MARLDSAVARLESASAGALERYSNIPAPAGEAQDGQQLELMETELAELRLDYEALRKAAATVADRLDTAIERYETPEQEATP